MNIKLECICLLSLDLKDLVNLYNYYRTQFDIINKEIWDNIDQYSISIGKTIYFNYIRESKIPILSYNKFNINSSILIL
jgi:hypothetical protein